MRFFELKIHQNAFAAGTSPRTPLEELTALLQAPLVGFQGASSWQGRAGEEMGEEGSEGRKGGERKGESFPSLLFLQFNHCLAGGRGN